MTHRPEQPPLFTEGHRPYSPKTEADELRVAILEAVGRALQRTLEPEGTTCPRCSDPVRALAGVGEQPAYAYCRSCLWWSKVLP